MEKTNLDEVTNLFTELVFPFYEVNRDMIAPLSERRRENDAEHSWALGLIACALAERIDTSLDVGKIAQLAAVHDLVEIGAGDTSVWDESMKATKEEREKQALIELKRKFSTFPWLVNNLEEYETRLTPEAKFVSAVDKYIAVVTRLLDARAGNRVYINEVPLTVKQYIAGIKAARHKAHAHQGVGEMYEEVYSIFLSHPEWFVEE
ncbi:MAG TPA: HD domain-containing protein [Candidatus Nitrosopolaris sp.]|nr:HD domain-containing protein [Candidatus Nitrosopolaris sp.]